MVFLKDYFEKVNLKKKSTDNKKACKKACSVFLIREFHKCFFLNFTFKSDRILLQISHGGLILLRNVKPDETEEIVEPVVGKYKLEF